VAMATHAARRVSEMAQNVAAVIGIEAIAAAQGIELRAPLTTSPRLTVAKSELRRGIPPLQDDRVLADDIVFAARLIADGTLARAAGIEPTLEAVTRNAAITPAEQVKRMP